MELKDNWSMYRLPMNKQPDLRSFKNNYHSNHPVIYEGGFNLTKTGDTFLDMRVWGKGIVFVNGHNLGRYWNAGPQQTLYLPGCWLHTGKNTITIFEQENNEEHNEITSAASPILAELKAK
jgi:beta-galactosidase